MPNQISRRDFLYVTAGASGLLSGGGIPALQLDASQTPASGTPEVPAGWFDRPMRWVQLTLV